MPRDIVGVGGHEDPADGQAHSVGGIPCERVPEIAGRHAERHLAAGSPQRGGCREVVDGLRGDARKVDRIDAAEVDSLAQGLILKGVFDDSLAIVERSLDRHAGDVGLFGRRHEPALNLADAALREEGHDLDGLATSERLDGRAAGVARSGAKNRLVPALGAQQVIIEPGQDLHRHILEGEAWAVEQFRQKDTRLQLLERHDRRMGEGGVGLPTEGEDFAVRDLIVGEGADHPRGDIRIPHVGEAGDLRC